MAGFDTTNVAATVGQGTQQTSPLEMVENLAVTKNLLNQNRLFQSQQAAGQAFQSAINPDGTVSQNRLMTGLQDPAAALSALPMAEDTAQLRTHQQSLAAAQTSALQSIIASEPPGPNQVDNIRGRINAAVASGVISPDVASNWAGGNIPGLPSYTDLAKAAAIQGGSASELKAQEGDISNVSLGGTVQPVKQQYTAGGITQAPTGTPMAMTRSPENMAAPVSVLNPATGQTEMHPSSEYIDASGNLKPGVTPPVTGWAPGVAEAKSSDLQAQQQQANSLLGAYTGSAARENLLEEMRATLATKDFRTGPGAQQWSGYVTEANRIFGTNFDANPANAQQVFGKMAEQFASLQRNALGNAATDAQSAAARIASPNSAYSNEANRQGLALLEGNEKLLQTQYNAWKKYQGAAQQAGVPANYGDFSQKFWSLYNPRYFQEKYMTPTQLQTMRASMSPADQAAYDAAKKRALGLNFAP